MEMQAENLKTMVAEIELVYRNQVKPSERPAIKCSQDCYNILLDYWNDNSIELFEECKLVLLNQAGRVLGIIDLSAGGVTGTVVDAKLIFAAALKANAPRIILAHNHPSGNLKPSEADKRITEKVASAGKLLDIKLLDHLIITTEGYYSFGDEGAI